MLTKIIFWIGLLLFSSLSCFSQKFQLNSAWESLGPNAIPDNSSFRRDAGLGPIEFIRISKTTPGNLLAGSLSGGLFYSQDNGLNWKNAGSDDWQHSGCPWADFHPALANVWFAVSNKVSNNGKPGSIGEGGGVYRKKQADGKWELIGNYKDFGGSPYTVIYGTRFHPTLANKLYVMTDNGLYVSANCMSNSLAWTKVEEVEGLIYDLDFIQNQLIVSSKSNNKWHITVIDIITKEQKQIAFLADIKEDIINLTFEPTGNNLLILIDYSNKSDALIHYNLETTESTLVSKNEQVNFGSGHAFAVSPFNLDEFFIGYDIKLNKKNIQDNKAQKIGNEHHVDVEFIAYSPFDSSTVFIGTHGGVYFSNDGGSTWADRSNGLGVVEVMGMSVSATDNKQVSIGCYHDGTMLLADHDSTGNYTWRTINGGDGLNTIIDPTNKAIIYTANQYTSGGLHYSNNLGVKNQNIHALSGLKSSGWEMAAVLHPEIPTMVFFNFLEADERNKGNVNITRIENIKASFKAKRISDFNRTHGLKNYKVYGLFHSKYHPNLLYAYVLNQKTAADGHQVTEHLLFRTKDATKSSEAVIESWVQLEHPLSNWIGDVETDGHSIDKIYISYVEGKSNPETVFGDKGMVYALKYSANGILKRQWDISKNLPNSLAGRNNLHYVNENRGILFIATETGVYFGRAKILKGKSRWQQIGEGLPHCKVYGFHYDEKYQQLTVGLLGRGVWRYNL